jgi:4-amino-4-deoxy-L-arabinose transferase-like glycosyltransferase
MNNKLKINHNNLINYSIGIFLVLTWFFGLITPITSDAGKYAAISRQIYETGDWINLKIHFEPYLQKPPLIFWITAPFYSIFGPTGFAFKLPVLLYSGIAVYSTYRFTKLFYSKKNAKIAALMLATSEFYFLFHNDIHTDCLLTANVIFSVWQLAEYFKSERLSNMLLAGLGIGLGLISKGPIGVFVPVAATLSHLIYKKQIKLIFNYKMMLGAFVTLLVLAAGLAGIFNQFGREGLEFFFWDNNAGRISGKIKGGNTDYLFYFHTALYIFLPWAILFFIGLFMEFKTFFKSKKPELFCLGGIFFYWIIISVAKAKAPHYLMVISPFMAVLTAKWLLYFFENKTSWRMQKTIGGIQFFVNIFLWLALFSLCIYFFPSKSILFWLAILLLLFLFFLTGKLNNKLKQAVLQSVISIIALNFAINAHLFPQIFTYHSVIPACEVFNEKACEGEMLNTYRTEHRELFFYAKNPGHFLYDSDDLADCLTRKNDWIFTNDEGLREIEQSTARIELIRSFKHRSLSKLTPGFINPATRTQRLTNMYLVKIIEPAGEYSVHTQIKFNHRMNR